MFHAPRRVIDKVKGVRNSVAKLGGATLNLMGVQRPSTGLQNHYTGYSSNLAGVASPNLVTDFHTPEMLDFQFLSSACSQLNTLHTLQTSRKLVHISVTHCTLHEARCFGTFRVACEALQGRGI